MSSNNVGKQITDIHIGQKKVIIKFLDGKMDLTLNAYAECRLFKSKILTRADIDKINALNELDIYQTYAKKLLAASYRSENYIREKLKAKGAKPRQINEVVKQLKLYSLIDDKTYLKELLDLASYKHFGKTKTIAFLKQKGIEASLIKTVVFTENSEEKKAMELLPALEKRFSKYCHQGMKDHVYAALIRNGFSNEIAKRCVETLKSIDSNKEFEILRKDYIKIFRKYLRKYEPDERNQKIVNYLMQKGYRYKDIIKVKGEMLNES